jgi:hypothetical protein
VLLAVGLVGYALWRMVRALLDPEGEGLGWFGPAKRAVYLGIGAFYGYLPFFAFGLYCALLSIHRDIDNEAAVHGSHEES